MFSSTTRRSYTEKIIFFVRERDDLAERLQAAAIVFGQFQSSVNEKHDGYRARMLSAFLGRLDLRQCRLVFNSLLSVMV